MTTIYTAFGVIGNCDLAEGSHTRLEEYEDEFPEDELHKEIIGIHVDVHGDAIDQAFLEVYGINKDLVEEKWDQIASSATDFLKSWWINDID